MIKWNSLIREKNDRINSSRLVSEDGRFEIRKEERWNLYDDKAPDKRWCRYSEDTLLEAKRVAERIIEEERIGNNPYDRDEIVED